MTFMMQIFQIFQRAVKRVAQSAQFEDEFTTQYGFLDTVNG